MSAIDRDEIHATDFLIPDRLMAKRVIKDGCWEWTGWHNNLGYGYISWNGQDRPVHRLIMELLGRVPDPDFDVDHLCRNPGCWDPDHLEAVPHQVNIRRGKAATKTACKYGHDWNDPHNVRTRRTGERYCAECDRQQCRERYARRKAR